VLLPTFLLILAIGIVTGVLNPRAADLSSDSPFSLLALVANLAGLQTIFVPQFGGNYPLWSLANETWYYVLFPLLVLVFRGRTTAARAAAVLAIAAIVRLVPGAILLYFSIWLLGAGFSRIRIEAGPVWRWIVLLLLAGSAVLIRLKGKPDITPEGYPQYLLFSLVFVLSLSSMQFQRRRVARLDWLDRPTGQVIRRYERARPGELVHVDVKKLGAIRPGGGWWATGRGSWQDRRARRETDQGRRVGYDYVHCAIDDHTRLAYAEIHPDETGQTCAGFLTRAAAWFAAHGISRIERVMTDNAFAYRRSRAWRQALDQIGAQPRFTRAYRPQTNGKAERFNRTLLEEWGYARPFNSSAERTAALPQFLHTYNHHRAHTALSGNPPISRLPVNDLTGHYS
jgi:transposase InsO family protein